MWHYLFLMILAWTPQSKKDTRAAVQEWETEQGARFLPVSGLHLICLLLQCLVSTKDFFSFPSLPDGNWFNCLLNRLLLESLSLLWLYSTSRAVANSMRSLRLPREIPPTTSKRPVKSKWKTNSTTCKLKSIAVGSTLPPDSFFHREFTDPE